MTETERIVQQLADDLRAAVAQERAGLVGAVEALIDADRLLEQRVEGLERLFLDRFADIHRDSQGVVRLDPEPELLSQGEPKPPFFTRLKRAMS